MGAPRYAFERLYTDVLRYISADSLVSFHIGSAVVAGVDVVVDAVVDVVVEAVVVTAVSTFVEVLASVYAVSGLVSAVASGVADVPAADTVSGGVAVV